MFKIKLGGGRTAEVEESMYWHTTSHIMAQAVKRLYPNAKLAIGPAIENGFYYDFDVELIKDLPEGEVISFYKQGDFTDRCRGPH